MTAVDLLVLAPRCRAVVMAALVALAASGCGRIGPLEPPPDANAPPKPNPTAAQNTQNALSPEFKPKIPPITPPNQSFILDPLLK